MFADNPGLLILVITGFSTAALPLFGANVLRELRSQNPVTARELRTFGNPGLGARKIGLTNETLIKPPYRRG
jgi:hypothetical protein